MARGGRPLGYPAAADTVIDLTYDSVMDMVHPEVHPGIAVHHNLQITLAVGGSLAEARNRSAGPFQDQNGMVQVLGSSGDEGAYASWQIAAGGRLVRVQDDPQSTRTMTVTLLPGHTCRLDVVDQLRPGFSEYAFFAHLDTHDRLFLDLPCSPDILHDTLTRRLQTALRGDPVSPRSRHTEPANLADE